MGRPLIRRLQLVTKQRHHINHHISDNSTTPSSSNEDEWPLPVHRDYPVTYSTLQNVFTPTQEPTFVC